MRYIASFVFVIGLFISLPLVTQAVSFTTSDFITTWDTENTGTSASNQITIPGTGAGYSYSVYWESLSSSTATGTVATSTSASQTITFPEPGEYKVAIKGTYPRIYFNNGGDKLKILTVEQWGNIAWTSMQNAFYGCVNLTVPATDAPNLTVVTTLNSMFRGAASFDQPIDHWDVSKIVDMSYLLYGATLFNQPLNNWNTSSSTSMANMFINATTFNQSLDNWNVSNVTTMSGMFQGATSFNQPLDIWDVSNVTNMLSIFSLATAFNQPLNSWNVSKVTNMGNMFRSTSFNYPLTDWNTASATVMLGMFRDSPFDQNLSTWNIANVTTMDLMFKDSSLSQSNLDSTLTAWASQSLQSNVPFHLGLKTYSSTGQTALDTLENTYNWIITEQYQANYQEGDDYTLSGTTTQSPINLSGTTTAIEVIPDNRCTFINWSDNNTQNPRADTLTDNLTVSANVECRNPSTGTSAKGRADKLEALGNTAEANTIRQEYNLTPSSTLHTAITTLTTLATNPTITNNPQAKQQLISLLQQLVQILREMTGESN